MKTQDSRREHVTPIGLVNGLDAGRAALGRGDWPAARRAFEESLQTGGVRGARGSGARRQAADLSDVVFDVRERAYRIYREATTAWAY